MAIPDSCVDIEDTGMYVCKYNSYNLNLTAYNQLQKLVDDMTEELKVDGRYMK